MLGVPRALGTEPRGAHLKVLQVIAGLFTDTGGPAGTVPGLCRALAHRGHSVTLVTGEGHLAASVLSLRDIVRVRSAPLGPYVLANYSPGLARIAHEESARADVVHVHGVWLHPDWAGVRAGLATSRPVVRSPRGMLSAWTFARSRPLKYIVWLMMERSLFAKTALIHATSEQELNEVRHLGLSSPVAVIGNGVDLEGEFTASRIERLRGNLATSSRERRRVLFMSRLHPKKGLDLLLAAWNSLPPDLPAELILAGPGSPSEVDTVNQRIHTLSGPPAKFVGHVIGENRIRLLASAWVLVLPSRNENYGMVVAEALATGTPVITTRSTPWSSLAAERCGWWIDLDGRALRDTLQAALALTDEHRSVMAVAARRLIERHHSITAATERMETAYEWLLRPGTPPPEWLTL